MSDKNEARVRIGFAGLGAMGFGMASNLLKDGYDILGFDVFEASSDRFATVGGKAVASVAESCKGRDLYISMVATPQQLDNLCFGDEGLAPNLPHGAIFCSCSTLPPSYIASLPKKFAEEGRSDIRIMECPVSGGVTGATQGTLSIMAAGDEATYAQLLPTLSPVSASGRLFYCGANLGAANTLKMINQHLAGTHIVAAAETLSFAKALNLSTRQAYEIAMSGVAASWIFGDRGTHMLNADWSPKSAVDIFVKDLSIVVECARDASFNCPIATEAHSVFVESSARGDGRKDDAAVVCLYEEEIGMIVAESATPCSSATPSRSSSTVEVKSPAAEDATFERIATESVEAWYSLITNASTRNTKSYVKQPLSGAIPEDVVILTGLNDPSEAEEVLSKNYPEFQGTRFIDCQILPGSVEPPRDQILISRLEPGTAAKIKAALQDNVEVHAIYGGVEAATSMFFVVRLSSLIHLAAAAECCRLAEAAGLSTDLVYKLISGAAGESFQFNKYFPAMAKRQFEMSTDRRFSSFDSLEQALSDLKTLENIVARLNFPARLLRATQRVFEKAASKAGSSKTSVTSIVQAWEDNL